MFVTSGHATERDWQIGFRYRNGQFRSEQGQLFGVDTQGQRYPIHSETPKVYLPVGNCLMGHIDGPDAMALAFLNSAGVCQMIGYTVPTWYGYAGWGMLDYFLEQPGRFTLAEAFYANQQALVHRLTKYFPRISADVQNGVQTRLRSRGPCPRRRTQAGLNWNDARGLLFDRDMLAFYGDPAWISPNGLPDRWLGTKSWTRQDGEYLLRGQTASPTSGPSSRSTRMAHSVADGRFFSSCRTGSRRRPCRSWKEPICSR